MAAGGDARPPLPGDPRAMFLALFLTCFVALVAATVLLLAFGDRVPVAPRVLGLALAVGAGEAAVRLWRLDPGPVLSAEALLVLKASALLLSGSFAFESCDVLCRVRWSRPRPRFDPAYLPKASLHVPAYNEPPDMLIETIRSLDRLDYPDYEIVVVDPAYLRRVVGFFADPRIAFVQTPQDYREYRGDAYLTACYDAYRYFFPTSMPARNERNSIIFAGTMGLRAARRWSGWVAGTSGRSPRTPRPPATTGPTTTGPATSTTSGTG